MLDNDLVSCILTLLNDLFYNTGIATYILILINNKSFLFQYKKAEVLMTKNFSF
ncbi:N-6 DNA methylase [Lysinibacillus sp. TE18511]